MDSLMQTDHALPQRRHRKMLKDGSAEVWPQDAEDVFLEGLKDYWNSPWANTSRGRSRWRNQYLVDYLKKFGIERSKKQVASHIQVLRNMWKGHPEFALVAGPDAMSEGSSTSDRYSPPQRSNKLTSRSPTSRRRPSISHSSPPSTPTSNGSEYSEAVLKDSHHPQGLHLSPSITSQPPVIKSEYLQSPQGSLFEPSGLPSVPEVALEQPQSAASNSTVGFCLWAQNIEPTYVDVDALPFVDKPTSPGSPVPPQLPLRGIPRACLRFTLRLPTEGSGCDAMGFSGAITFSRPLASSARVVTRVHINNVPVSQEVQPLVPVHDQANAALTGQAMQERHVAMLPDSCLSRCNLLNTAGKKTRIIQQVIVDAEPLFVVGYDLYRLPVPHLTAELSSWTKVVDNRPPPEPSLDPLPIGMGRFGAGSSANEYLYGTAGSLPAHVSRNTPTHSHGFGHSRGHSVGSPTAGHPISPSTSLGSTQISASLSTGPSQATPTHANFTTLGSPMAPTSPHGSSSGSSTARSRSSFSQGNVGMGMGMGMTSGVNFPLPHHGHGNGHGSLMGSENFGQDPWTSNLLPLF